MDFYVNFFLNCYDFFQDIANDLPMEMANHMSFFYAEASPMLQKMSKAMSDFVEDNSAALGKTATDMLGMMATVVYNKMNPFHEGIINIQYVFYRYVKRCYQILSC